MKLILASGSEWRKRLVSWLDEPFEVVESGVDERLYEQEVAEEMVAMLAQAKARAVRERVLERSELDRDEGRVLIIGADTVIIYQGQIIGKPRNEADARLIMQTLQDQAHAVITGMCVMDLDSGETRVEVETTTVHFKPMSEKQINDYLNTGEWKGKAGGYQILRSIDPYVANLEGSITNVIGLPMGVLVDVMDEFGVSVGTNVAEVIKKETGYED